MIQCKVRELYDTYSVGQVCTKCGVNNTNWLDNGSLDNWKVCWKCYEAIPSVLSLITSQTERLRFHKSGMLPMPLAINGWF